MTTTFEHKEVCTYYKKVITDFDMQDATVPTQTVSGTPQGLVVDAYDVAGESCCQAVVDVVLAAQAHVCLWHLEG